MLITKYFTVSKKKNKFFFLYHTHSSTLPLTMWKTRNTLSTISAILPLLFGRSEKVYDYDKEGYSNQMFVK